MSPSPVPVSTADRSIVLLAQGVTKRFDSKVANDDVTFTVRAGEVHALLGENGAGKTTLISILCGQYRPDTGTIEVRGEPRRFSSPRDALAAGIGVVHQDLRQVSRFSVLENVVLGTSARAGAAAERKVQEIASDLGFNLHTRAIVSSLSVGERQQLEIIKLLFRGLSILILDEPTAVLSPQQSEQLFVAMRRLAQEGNAIIFISHRMREVTAAADVVTVLRQGRVVAHRAVASAKPTELARLMIGDEHAAELEPRPSDPGEPVLTLSGVSVRGVRRPLHEVDLTVRRGEIVGVAGVSGNGQVELADVAAGLLKPEAGTRQAAAEVVAFIPEDRLASGLVGSMAIAENLGFRRYRRRPISHPLWLGRRRLREHAQTLIDTFQIPTDNPWLNVARLSGGGLQRVIVAREISETPDLLVAAQPTRGLDLVSARAVRSHILSARDRGAGVVLISEDLDELLELSDRLVVILAGRIVAEVARGEASRIELGRHMTGGREAA